MSPLSGIDVINDFFGTFSAAGKKLVLSDNENIFVNF